MKKIILILSMVPNIIFAEPPQNPLKQHFGVKDVFIKTNFGKFNSPLLPDCKKYEYGYFGNSEAGMLTNTIINVEAGVMINNLHLEEDEKMVRPKFIMMNVYFNHFKNASIYSMSYAQLTECQFALFGYKKMKAVWGVGPAYKDKMGIKFNFGGYSKEFGLKSDVYLFKGKELITNISLNRKIYKNFLGEIGTEYNQPKIGISYLYKSLKLNLATIKYKSTLSYGLTASLSI